MCEMSITFGCHLTTCKKIFRCEIIKFEYLVLRVGINDFKNSIKCYLLKPNKY